MSDVELRDHAPPTQAFRADVIRGLSATPKSLPCKYFYDKRGSRLFERICELEEYYPTRVEIGILRRQAAEIARVVGPRVRLVEPGSGSSVKTRLLLQSLVDPVAYVPIDISRQHLIEVARELAQDFPGLLVQPLCADYTQDLVLPPVPDSAARTVVFYPGSTIGNFEQAEARAFLRRLGRMAGAEGEVLIGVDLKKDPSILERAYDDRTGVTAAFNLNLLARINRELGGDFDAGGFAHRAVYEPSPSRVVIQLVSMREQEVSIGDHRFHFAAGEAITTEYSHKPSLEDFARLAGSAGLVVERVWTDSERLFSVQLLRRTT